MRLWWYRISDDSWCWNSTRSHLLHSGHSKKRFGRIRGSDDLSRRKALRNHNLHSGRFNTNCGRLKRTLCWSPWSDVSTWRKAIGTQFLHAEDQKSEHDEFASDVLSRGIALTTHNLPSGRLKKRFCWIRWSSVSRFRKAMRTNFLHPGLGRSRLSDVIIWRIGLGALNLPSGRLKKRHWSRCSDVSRCLKVIRTHFLHSENRKKLLAWIHEVMIYVGELPWEIKFCLLYVINATLVMSMKRLMTKGHLNAFSTFWKLKKAICTKSQKWCF
jgi:hypothetical protein